MLTALRAVENARHGTEHDLWAVNSDGEYHEERRAPEQPYKRAPETPLTLSLAEELESAAPERR